MVTQPKPITFRLYPEGRHLYAEVKIWPTKKAMRDNGSIRGRNYEASCGGRESVLVSKTGLFAELNFCRNRLGIGVVSHEMTHAGFNFAERRGLKLEHAAMYRGWGKLGNKNVLDRDSVEERFCYAVGEMCRQFTQKLYDLGIYQATVESKT